MTKHDHHHDMSMHEHSEHQMNMNEKHMDMDMPMAHHDMDHMDHMNHDDMMMHGGHMMHMGNMKRKLIVSLILTVPIILLSPMMGMKMPFTITGIPGQNWLVLLLGSILFFYGGTPFFSGARGELQSRKPAMMTLITMGIVVAYVYSLYATIMNALHPEAMVMDFFWELATLIDIMLIGHIIEMNAVMKAGSAVDGLAALVPKMAHRRHHDDHFMDVAISDLALGDVLLVKENERVPVDGRVLTGMPTLDESLLTGESTGVMKHEGDHVVGGSLNGGASFTMTVAHRSDDGFLAQVQHLVSNAQQNQSHAETLADRVAGWLFYAAMIVGILAFVIWTTLHGFAYALPIAVTVFIIACPHALGLAIPLVVARLTGLAAQNGLLIQNRAALERVNDLRYVLMDKTGTLTEGDFKVQTVNALSEGWTSDDVLRYAAALEQGSSHPLATGILKAAHDLDVPMVMHQTATAGEGVSGMIGDAHYRLVSPTTLPVNIDPQVRDLITTATTTGETVSVLLKHDEPLGIIGLSDAIKPDAQAFIESLHQQNITPVMLTGDNEKAAQRVAAALGIHEVRADLKPADKIELVKTYQANGAVMMIGDGVNDSPALAQADLGVAIGAGTDVAINASDVVLVDSKLADVTTLLELARQAKRKMTQNLWWGAGYNLIAIPLAAGILIPVGFKLDPMVGAILMSLSTIIVAINAMTLKLKK